MLKVFCYILILLHFAADQTRERLLKGKIMNSGGPLLANVNVDSKKQICALE